MPVCLSCRVAYMEGEDHTCNRGPRGAALYVPARWGLLPSLLTFGGLAGALWAVVPLAVTSMHRPIGQAATVVLSGSLTGVVLSLVLAVPLSGRKGLGTLLWGGFAYFLGAFVFGSVLSIVQLGALGIFGVEYRALIGGFAPVQKGLHLAFGALFWPAAVLLGPLAIWTTYQLRLLVEAHGNPPAPPRIMASSTGLPT